MAVHMTFDFTNDPLGVAGSVCVAKLRDWWDVSWNPVSGCRYLTDECTHCYDPDFLLKHPHEAPTVHDGVLNIIKQREKQRAFWNGEFRDLPDGHHGWNFPREYRGAEHPKLGPGKQSLILTGAAGDLFIGGRSPKIIDRVVERIALSPHIGLFISKYTGPQYEGQMAPISSASRRLRWNVGARIVGWDSAPDVQFISRIVGRTCAHWRKWDFLSTSPLRHCLSG
jgi:hypothetical protein